MAIRHTKRKIAPKRIEKPACKKVVLVGTYKTQQLESWSGYYNYPLSKGDDDNETSWRQVNELWLFKGKTEGRYFAAECLGVKTRDELKKFGYKAKGEGRSDRYVLFKIAKTYAPAQTSAALAATVEKVIVRIKDFKTAPKVQKQLKAYLESTDRKEPALARQLPTILVKVPYEILRVCEAAVQFDFMQMMFPERRFPAMCPLLYANGGIEATEKVRTQAAQVFRMGEFFCGPGGLACGALSARIECDGFRITHAWANDYDAQTCATYRENICHEEPETVICGDVRKLDLDDKRLTAIDGFAFGFPCNDFSVVGEHKGIDGNYGPLYQYGVAVLKKFRPRWFVAENVGGLASANEGAAFKKILASMKDAGYRIYPHLYKFEEYGVPQSRHRIIIVGIRSDQPQVFNPPSPALLAPRDNSAKAALENPPIPPNAPNNDRTAQHPKVVERLRYIKPGQNAFTAKLPAHLQLNVKGAKISQIYKRLDPCKPAYTVTGSGGGGTHIYHYSEPRALTNRERARLQTFPDAYLFTGSKESVRKQIGMAVPPRGAQIIFEALLRTFAGISYKHIECNITDDGELK